MRRLSGKLADVPRVRPKDALRSWAGDCGNAHSAARRCCLTPQVGKPPAQAGVIAEADAYNRVMKLIARLNLVAALAVLPLAAAVAQTTAPTTVAPAAPTAKPRAESESVQPSRTNQKIERIRTEDQGSRIDELRVGGETQQITVQPKTGGVPYEVLRSEGARGNPPPATSGDTNGSRVWNVLKF